MKGNYTLREVYGSGGARHKLIRLLEQPSIIREVINKANEKLITAKIDYENKRYEDSVSRSYYWVRFQKRVI